MAADLKRLLSRFDSTRVLLVGDLMLDRYVFGEVSRISPEAPVPVLKVVREEERLGGAGSVIANLRVLRAQVRAVSAVGQDAAGERVKELLAEQGVDTAGVLTDPGIQTTQKIRLIARTQQLLRLDHDGETLSEAALAQLTVRAIEQLDGVDVVLVSDYGRAVLEGELCLELAAAARERGIPVIADPHRNAPFARYTGVSGMTPNRAETENAIGIRPGDVASRHAAARTLIERFDLEWATVTLDKDGIFLLEKGAEVGQLIPARTRAVYDVTGAGDMVLTALGLAIAAGASLVDAVRLANVAAGVEVERLGVVPITRREIEAELLEYAPPNLRRKIVDMSDVDFHLERPRKEGRTIVFTNGCFDILHSGHVHFLEGCRAKGDYLVVGLNGDDSIRRLKGPDRPVLDLQSRSTVLAGLEAVDLIVPFHTDTPEDLIRQVHPDVLCKGEDYRGKVVVGREIVEEYGGRVELVDLVPGQSTTNIVKKIEDQQKRKLGQAPEPERG